MVGRNPPDLGDDGVENDLDPSLSNSEGDERISFQTPSAAASWRVAVARREGGDPENVTINVAVDGVNRFGATRTLSSLQLWSGIRVVWNGTDVTVTRSDVTDDGLACVGQPCGATCGQLTCFEQGLSNDLLGGLPIEACAQCGSNGACS